MDWFVIRLRILDLCNRSINPQIAGTKLNPKSELLRELNLGSDQIHHPHHGTMRIKVRGASTTHYNASFSSKPNYLGGWDSLKLLQKFGYPDKQGHSKALRIRVGIQREEDSEKLGLRIQGDKVLLVSASEEIGFWESEVLMEGFARRSRILSVGYRIDELPDAKQISYTNPIMVFLNTVALENSFEEMVSIGKISPEFRMYLTEDHSHCRERGKKPGVVRDHGFGWRLKSAQGDPVYSTVDISEG